MNQTAQSTSMVSKRLDEPSIDGNLKNTSSLKKQKVFSSPTKATSNTTLKTNSNEFPLRTSSIIDQVNEENNPTRTIETTSRRVVSKAESRGDFSSIDPMLRRELQAQQNQNSDPDSDSVLGGGNFMNAGYNDDDDDDDAADDDDDDTDADNEYLDSGEVIPSIKTLSSLFQQKELSKLSKILKNIESCIPSELNEYKKSVDVKERRGDKLISELFKENEQLKGRIIELKTKVHEVRKDKKSILRDAENEISRWKTLIISSSERAAELENQVINLRYKRSMSNNDDFEDDDGSDSNDQNRNYVDINEQALNIVNHNYNLRKNKDLQINFLELLTGVRCIAFEESNYTMNFTVRQSGGIGTIYYKLIISKKIEERHEAIYMPIWDKHIDFKGDWDENVKNVKKYLPDYLMDQLTFPSSAINYFNSKLNDCLNQ